VCDVEVFVNLFERPVFVAVVASLAICTIFVLVELATLLTLVDSIFFVKLFKNVSSL
jgi:hypothetical protein